MDTIQDFSLEVIRWLQGEYTHLAAFLRIVSDLGRFEFYLAVVPLIYWCVHKALGKELAYLLAVANAVLLLAKQAIRAPRPFWLDDTLALSSESGFGTPSGHVQIATVIYLYVAAVVRQRRAWVLAFLAIGLMGFSRVFLGMHFLHDVFAGFLVGVLILFACWAWRANFRQQFRNRILGQRLLVVMVVPIFFLTLYVVLMIVLSNIALEVAWDAHAIAAEADTREEMTAALGILLGLGVGFILEASRVHFMVAGSLSRRLLRYLFGMLVTVAIWRGLAMVFPQDPAWLGLPLRLLRYTLAGLWVSYYGPYLFVRLGLADASPEPDVQLTISDGSFTRP
ncbi:MAG TPA: phosphatase PAP2 family protein [Candidatus Sulfomarinibacteraceae bacterium]|nr:phosphatase PAP2 family protein [Candidatus Sulfomarinibacteraceae bacterium]